MQANEMAKNIQAMMHQRTVHYKEAILSILLGLPDGITYLIFGLSAGDILAYHFHLQGLAFSLVRYFVGIGAALGVAFFAINNVSREYTNIFKKTLSDGYRKNCAFARNFIRIASVFIALLSAIPFAGMAIRAAHMIGISAQGAETAGVFFFYLLVVSNALARFCMNDYALSHVLGDLFDRLRYFYNKHFSKHSMVQFRADYIDKLQRLSDEKETLTHAKLMTIRRKLFKNPLNLITVFDPSERRKTESEPTWLWVSLLGFFAGAYTATYLFSFAVDSSKMILLFFNIHNSHLVHLLALFGIIPTCFLWGNETLIALTAIFKYLYTYFKRGKILSKQHVSAHWLVYQKRTKILLLVFFAAAGAYSETLMSYHTLRFPFDGVYSFLLFVFTPIAFISIYSVCVIELVDKIFAMFAQRFYFGHVTTLRSEINYFSEHAKQFIYRVHDDDLQELLEKKKHRDDLL